MNKKRHLVKLKPPAHHLISYSSSGYPPVWQKENTRRLHQETICLGSLQFLVCADRAQFNDDITENIHFLTKRTLCWDRRTLARIYMTVWPFWSFTFDQFLNRNSRQKSAPGGLAVQSSQEDVCTWSFCKCSCWQLQPFERAFCRVVLTITSTVTGTVLLRAGFPPSLAITVK